MIVNQRRLNVSLLRSPTVQNRIPGCQWFTTVQIQTFSTNGIGIYQVDMRTGVEGYINQYPTPIELWDATFSKANQGTMSGVESWRDLFADIPFEDRSGTWEARYYQHNAIKHVLEAICQGKDRILLTMATGTGKTFVAVSDAVTELGSVANISEVFIEFQQYLYSQDKAA